MVGLSKEKQRSAKSRKNNRKKKPKKLLLMRPKKNLKMKLRRKSTQFKRIHGLEGVNLKTKGMRLKRKLRRLRRKVRCMSHQLSLIRVRPHLLDN